MKRIGVRLAVSGLLGVALAIVSAGVAEARIALNHNETLLHDEG
jgi:hypothetical protein